MKLLALVLAGGEGHRLHPLTAEHAKPAVRFVDGDRIVDFVLSSDAAGRFKGTADAVYQNLGLIARHLPDIVAVFAADHIFRMDLRQMVEAHRERSAYVTVAAVPVPIERARSFGVIAADASGRITQFQEKPERPAPMPTDPTRAYVSGLQPRFNLWNARWPIHGIHAPVSTTGITLTSSPLG